jgi:hypothetical protein
MFLFSRNHNQGSYNYPTKYILACVYSMGPHIAYSGIETYLK